MCQLLLVIFFPTEAATLSVSECCSGLEDVLPLLLMCRSCLFWWITGHMLHVGFSQHKFRFCGAVCSNCGMYCEQITCTMFRDGVFGKYFCSSFSSFLEWYVLSVLTFFTSPRVYLGNVYINARLLILLCFSAAFVRFSVWLGSYFIVLLRWM